MNIFVASLATETNTFSPLRTNLSHFKESFYAAPGEHPSTPTLCSAVFPVCRRWAAEHDWTLIEGTATWAEPGGMLNAATWHHLRDEILQQVERALPLDAVVLGLHGAMVAQNCLDCEGELLQMIRALVGPDCVIGATLDPHSHLTQKRLDNSDVLVAFKEFPHTDFVQTAENCVRTVHATLTGKIKPTMAMFDCRMIEIFPTDRSPMREYVDKLCELESSGAILSASVIHGFMAGDVPELGTKMLVITDNDPRAAQSLAEELGMQLFEMRGSTRPNFLSPAAAVQQLKQQANTAQAGPIVLADVWDNPGGGVPGDSTILLREVLAQQLRGVSLATIWDPMAVRICHSAGAGAVLQLRFGGKTSATGGEPIDATVTVKCIQRDAWQSFGDSLVPLGDSAVIAFEGIEVILNTNRCQAFEPDIFSNMGIDPLQSDVLIVKSTNHFYGGFAPIAKQILYVEVDGPYPNDPKHNHYQHLSRDLWPRVEFPHGKTAAASGS